MTSPISLIGGKVLTPGGVFVRGDLHIADGSIVKDKPATTTEIDCRGLSVLPGMIDVHGDAFEGELYPRPGVGIRFDVAMRSVDRQLLTNGITTVFHGLSLSWEPGMRSLPSARQFMQGLTALRPQLAADHRIQLRWETFAHDAIADIAAWLPQHPVPTIAFNDHTTDTLEAVAAGHTRRLERWAQRAGLTVADYVAAAEAVHANAPGVSGKIAEVAALARSYGATLLAHDEQTTADRATNRCLGMSVTEFPLTKGVAADAVACGEHVVMGAPNVLRGESHKGDMSAEEAIREGVCTVLASDYYYPGMVHAAEHLVRRGICSVGKAWALVSANPAAAMGLADRGALAVGHRADVVVIDCAADWRLVHTLSSGALTSIAS